MRCVICRQGETQPGTTTVTLECGDMTLVFKNVPAQVCDNCGEAYVDEQVSGQILSAAEEAARYGVQVDIREFIATPAWAIKNISEVT
ncbi:MAG: type II toxin-antitoxin system MqsA family antitoxin [Anaerolineae bacterium]|nr:type II toxin-antitoxin system MqsA family antitoxin [Anaerolineae bacterium]